MRLVLIGIIFCIANIIVPQTDDIRNLVPITGDNVTNLDLLATFPSQGSIYDFVWLDTENTVAIASVGGVCIIKNPISDTESTITQIVASPVFSIAYNHVDNIVAFVDGYTISIYDISENMIITTVEQDNVPIQIAFNSILEFWAIGYGNGDITLWDINLAEQIVTFTSPDEDNAVHELVFASDGEILASGHQR